MFIQSILYGTCAATPNMTKKIVKYFIRRHNEWTFSLLDGEYFSTLNNLKKEIKKKFLKMLLCISFSCKKLLSPHLLQGILKEGWGLGRNGRWVAGGGGDWRVLISLIGFFQITISHCYRESYLLQFPSLFHCSYSFSMCILT